MEIRERRSPQGIEKPILNTIMGDLSGNNQNITYPVKPAFPTNDLEDQEDEEENFGNMVIMTTCCCCCSTKNGSIAIGLICLVIGFFISVAACFALINVDEFQLIIRGYYENYEKLVAANKTSDALSLIKEIVTIDIVIDKLQIFFIVTLVFSSVYTFSALFLTYGACCELRSLLIPWIILEFVPFAMQLAGIVYIFVSGKDNPTLANGGLYIVVGLMEIVFFVIHVYWWMCPVAYYQNLKKTTEVHQLVTQVQPIYPVAFQKY